MATKKEHTHIIPAFYLRKFLASETPPSLYLIDKDNPSRPRKVSPRDAGVRRRYYTIPPGNDNIGPDDFEDFLGDIEKASAPILPKVVARQTLSSDERVQLAIFLGYTSTRGPSFRDPTTDMVRQTARETARMLTDHPDAIPVICERFKRDMGHDISVSAKDLRNLVETPDESLSINPAFIFALMSVALDTAHIYTGMRWNFFHSERPLFVTSDNPLVQVIPGLFPHSGINAAITDPKVEVSFPLTQSVGVILSPTGNEGHHNASRKRVLSINERTIASAQRFVYAPSDTEETKDAVEKYREVRLGIRTFKVEQPDGPLLISLRDLIKRERKV
jgi:hypothetical protein